MLNAVCLEPYCSALVVCDAVARMPRRVSTSPLRMKRVDNSEMEMLDPYRTGKSLRSDSIRIRILCRTCYLGDFDLLDLRLSRLTRAYGLFQAPRPP